MTSSASRRDIILTRLNAISASLNQTWGDPAEVTATLRLIVQSVPLVIRGASAAVFTYDPQQRGLAPAQSSGEAATDAWPPLNMGERAVQQMRPVFSYEDGDLHGARAATDTQPAAVACWPLLVGKEAVGVLFVRLHDGRRLEPRELLILSTLANQAGLAISHAGRLSDVQRDLARKEDELHRLRRAGLLISSRTRLDETLVTILQMALEVTGAHYGIFRLVDKEGQNLITRAIAGDRLGSPAVEALPINATSITGLVAKTRQPVCIRDVRENPWSRIYYPLDHALEMRSELAVPLIGASGRLEGVLNLESPVVGEFSDEDSHLLQALATQAVIAIQEVRLLDALQEVAERLLSQPLQQVLDHLVELACDLLNARASAIWTLTNEQLILSASSGGHVRGHNLPTRGSLTGEAILSRALVTSEDVRADARFAWRDLARAQGWKHAMIAPLLASDGQPVGAFSVYGSAVESLPKTVSDWDNKVLTILAHYAALAVRSAADQAALRAAEEQRIAAETFAAVGDIAANLLHQLNNKIGTIPVRVEGIQDKSGASVAADAYLAANLEEIGSSAREAIEAVRESLSHLQTISSEPVSVAASVLEALAQTRPPATITVLASGLDDLPPVIAGRRSLTLVFTNLIENAVVALDGQGQIEIVGRASERWVEVDVRDSGPGIAPHLHERIFELSFSGRRAARSSKLGFGLWWVKTWLTRLGGAIAVESDGVHGACFTLRLPRVEGGS